MRVASACSHPAGSSSSAGISRRRPVRRPRPRPAHRAGGTPPAAPDRRSATVPEVMQRSAKSTDCSAASTPAILDMHHRRRLQDWHRSPWPCAAPPAPPSPRGAPAAAAPISPPAPSSSQPSGVAGMSCRCTEPILAREARQPDILGREHQDRREPGRQAVEQQVQHRARRAARQAGRAHRNRAQSLRMSK